MIAKTYHGLEDVLAKELLQLGAQDIKTLRRVRNLKAIWVLCIKPIYLYELARIIKPIKNFKVRNEDQLYRELRIDWEHYMSIDDKFRVIPL